MIDIYEESNGLLVDLRQDISVGDDAVLADALEGKQYKKIVLLIDVFGGDFSPCVAIYEKLLSLKNTQTIGIAKRAYSGGLVILLGCKIRIAAKREDWMITLHPVFMRKSIPKLELSINNALKESSKNGKVDTDAFWESLRSDVPTHMQSALENILLKRTTLPQDEITKIMGKPNSTELSLEEAFECGIINELSHT